MTTTEKEFGSDGQVHSTDKPTVKPVPAKKPGSPADPFAASEPGAASQRTGEDHKAPAAAPSTEEDKSKFGG